MDETDGWLFSLALAGLGLAVILICHAIRSLQQDLELLRMTAAVPLPERDT
jgi:hypothetical protein